MKIKFLFINLIVFIFTSNALLLFATPSTQIWIPSTDFQKFGTFHLGIDDFLRVHDVENTRGAAMYDLGLTAGILPLNKIQGEFGIDYIYLGDGVYDNNPLYFNLKVGTPEDSLFKGSPAIAIGGYNLGFKPNLTDYNIGYGIIAKTFPVIGRLSFGYYIGNKKVLVDENMKPSEKGLLVSWDRQMNEISDKLWFGIDYQGGENYLGSLNFGVSWAFSAKTSVLVGYCVYNNSKALYNTKDTDANSFTTQVDINF